MSRWKRNCILTLLAMKKFNVMNLVNELHIAM